ncbi:uncharacterized protein TrAFT101_003912 [Trichoderma asperellum]|uniref:NB-ARC domain-containing protein n=1 Tax=Trichoderma asperellum (strain ATCC 204424 / CBS 433.97 / NBRC 101777) TaxID=1042311 RepID=A0A2T3ZPA6_TRIA4|nr:hypothetical protein M441DRAFT_156718 [Trichoderma asperellum CBS 433.97]PTB46639.1 hypothetical protein M441DRAFT_156718 [Trichoderma asperellum CBS 433.97]UKZ88149.1 hypothetical protein TrAFT101_003912 [Trichoderma asperellum]
MEVERFQTHTRSITGNQLGDYVTIHQGDVHYYHAAAPSQPRTPIQSIPYLRNKEFVNRPGVVDKLQDLLVHDSESFNDAVLWGLGGSGKTQIAIEYAYRRCENPQCSVFWVHADTRAAFIHGYRQIAELFGLQGILDGQELDLLRAVSNRIQSEPQWLLVLDNADDLSLFGVGGIQEGSTNLFDFVPKTTAVGTTGSVLWTSRDGQVAGSLVRPLRKAVQIPHMTSMEARELLAMARGRDFEDGSNDDIKDEDQDTEKLLEELQWLPLGISQAGAYMRRTETTVREYLALLSNNEERWPLLKNEQVDIYRETSVSNSVLKIWSISVARVEQENFLASELLRVMAYFDNRDIPYDMVEDAARYVSTSKLRSVDVKRAIVRLKEFSFIKLREGENGGQSYEMHKLVQEATQYAVSAGQQMDQDDCSKRSTTNFARIAIQVVDNLFPDPQKEHAMHGGIGMMEEAEKVPDLLKRCEKYFAHVVKVADWTEISNEEKTLCVLLSRVSRYLNSLRRWKDKELVDIRILALRSRLFGPDHVDTIRSEKMMSKNYYKQNRFSEALEIEKRVFTKLKSALGERNWYTVESMHNMANIMCRLSQFEEAEKMQVDAIELLGNVMDGRAGMLMVDCLHCLARAYYGQQKFDKVEEACVRSLQYCRDNLGGVSCHWYVSAATRTLQFRGQALVIQGYLRPQATTMMEGIAEEICKRIQRQTHLHEVPRTELLVSMKAAVYKYAEVIDMQERVVEFYRKTFGENYHLTMAAMRLLARLLHNLCRYDEAAPIQIKVVKFFRDAVGEEHPLTLDNMVGLATIYRGQGRFSESEDIEKKVRLLYSKMLGRSFALRFLPGNSNFPPKALVDADNEVGKMQLEYYECLLHPTHASKSLPATAARKPWMGQLITKSTMSSKYRLLYIFSFSFSFIALVLSCGFYFGVA